MSLETEIRALTDEVKTLATIARAIVAGRSLNVDTAAQEAPTTGAPVTVPTPEAAAPAAEVENVPNDPAGFMAALHALVVGRSDAKDVMRAALEAIGASSFRTLDSARYAEALAAVKAELAKAEA